MANYIDGTEGGKHNSDNIESSSVPTTYEVVLRFTDIQADSPSKAVEKIVEWIKDGVDEMVFDVIDEVTKKEYVVDLADDYEAEVKD